MTKVSIITPVFNGARFILEAANSVLAQDCRDWEWIIVNDGSTDGTMALLDGLDDPRIKVIHRSNAGASAARNAGLSRAQGEYITFLDADDLLPSNALHLRAAFLDAHPDVDIVNGGVRVSSRGVLLRHYSPDLEEGPLLERLAQLQEGVFFSVNYMMRRLRIGDHRFPEGLSNCEDLIFFLTLAHDKSLRYGSVEEEVYEYRIMPGSAMSNMEGLELGYLEFLRRCAAMPRIDDLTYAFQVRRVRTILFRSWLGRGRPLRALMSRKRVSKLSKRNMRTLSIAPNRQIHDN